MLKSKLKAGFTAAPRYRDVIVLAVFAILITFQPHFMHGKINIFETGLYLPGIQSILDGEVPFRDVFHLRGPFELYMPALLMKIFGEHLAVLYSYFYFGNVLCLILCILIAKELIKTRGLLYLMTPVLIGRAWPRVVFAYWGGMRYVLGLLTLWFMIKFFKKNKPAWMFGAGLVCALAGFTSIEMGAYPTIGVFVALAAALVLRTQKPRMIFSGLGMYFLGAGCIVIPFMAYLHVHGALMPYLDGVWAIVTRMQVVIDPHQVSVYPRNLPEALVAMANPGHTNFKHMTPSYLYIFILALVIRRAWKRTFTRTDLILICLGVYGFIMYNTGFRGIWAAQFEMALQPEKVLLFYLYEVWFLAALKKKSELVESVKARASVKWYAVDRWNIYVLNAYMFILIASSVGYPIQRYNHRFFAFKFVRDKIMGKDTQYLKPLANEPSRVLKIERAKGIMVPIEQADEIEQIVAFAREHVREDEVLFTYADMGTYNFLADRRGFGRFPLATFTWFLDRWHEDFMNDLREAKPRYVIIQKEFPKGWRDVYLAFEFNRKKFRDVMTFIERNYSVERETPLSYIYKRNDALE